MLINCWEVRNLYCQYFSGFVRDTVNEEIFQIANENLKIFIFVGDLQILKMIYINYLKN